MIDVEEERQEAETDPEITCERHRFSFVEALPQKGPIYQEKWKCNCGQVRILTVDLGPVTASVSDLDSESEEDEDEQEEEEEEESDELLTGDDDNED